MSTQRIWANTVALATSTEGFPLRPQAKLVFDPKVAEVLEAPRPADWAPPASFAPWLDFIASNKRYQVSNLQALYQAGVTIVAATDSPNLGMAPGDAMHQELQEIVAAGIPAGAALRAATLAPARLLGLDGKIGSIAAGKRADLLLLAGDPAQDIRNTERISAVYAAGRRVVRR
jgi:imidazolonepropionase-like amidohydrolase